MRARNSDPSESSPGCARDFAHAIHAKGVRTVCGPEVRVVHFLLVVGRTFAFNVGSAFLMRPLAPFIYAII